MKAVLSVKHILYLLTTSNICNYFFT